MSVLSVQLLAALAMAATAGLITVRKEDLNPKEALAHVKAALNNTEIDPACHKALSAVVAELEGDDDEWPAAA